MPLDPVLPHDLDDEYGVGAEDAVSAYTAHIVHVCTICGQPSGDHDSDCDVCDCAHFPPLCCPGCDCGSFEDAHRNIDDYPEDWER